jgi:hypothetical protein
MTGEVAMNKRRILHGIATRENWEKLMTFISFSEGWAGRV